MTGELVLLTGGTGFLGSAILIDLLKNGYRVRVAARSQSKIDQVRAAPSIITLNPPSSQLMFIMIPDMRSKGAYDEAVQGVDFIIHAAAPLPGSSFDSEQPEDAFVTTCVNGNLGILTSALERCKTVRRVVMTSSTVAIAPSEVFIEDTKEREIIRGPDTRVAVPSPPYDSQLQGYCAAKAAALHASEKFMKDNATNFDLISIMPSWILGRDELLTDKANSPPTTSTVSADAIIKRLSGVDIEPTIGNAILCADVARAHVKALDPAIDGNQSFLLNTQVKWEDTISIAKRQFPQAFESGIFREGGQQSTAPLQWDSSKAETVLGVVISPFDVIIKEVVEQYLELSNDQSKDQ